MATYPSEKERADQLEKALRDLTEQLDQQFGTQSKFAKACNIGGVWAADPYTEVSYPRMDAARAKARDLLSAA